MRVVIISKACIVGAYQRKLEELARFPDIQLSVVVPPAWRDSRGETKLQRMYTEGYDLVVTPLALNGHFHLHFYPRLGELLLGLKPDLLHVDEEPYNAATWQAIQHARRLAIPSCFFSWQNIHRRYPPPFRWFEQHNYGNAAHAIAGSQEAEDVLRAKGFRGPVSVIPQFGVDPVTFSPAKERTDHEDGLLRVGYAGGLVAEKGVDVLLQAMAAQHAANCVLDIAGEGSERGRLAAMAEDLGIADRVRFVGRIPSQQMPLFYRSLDLLVLPSRTRPNWKEQFGRVLIEAMACGVAVVGSDSGEIPRVIGDSGIIFREGDVQALVDALALLCGDRGRRLELGERARSRVMAQFTHAHVAAATHRVYLQMLGSDGLGRTGAPEHRDGEP